MAETSLPRLTRILGELLAASVQATPARIHQASHLRTDRVDGQGHGDRRDAPGRKDHLPAPASPSAADVEGWCDS